VIRAEKSHFAPLYIHISKNSGVKTMKNYFVMLFVVALLATAMVAALPEVTQVKINGDVYESGDSLVVERGDTLDIRVKLQAADAESNVEVDGAILGYEYSDRESVSDSVHLFDMDAGDTVYKDLTIKVPDKVENDYYDLRVRVGTRTGSAFEGLYRLHLTEQRHNVVIKDVVLSPESPIMSGKAILAIVRIKNMGGMDEEGIKMTVSIPELGISGSEFVDELASGESTSSEEIYLRIPACVKSGEYTLHTALSYDDNYEDTSVDRKITISAEESCDAKTGETMEEKTTIVVGSYSQVVSRPGPGISYPVLIQNDGKSAQTYTITVDSAEWANVQVSPSSVLVLSAGEMKTVYVYVVPKASATEGQHMFNINVKSAGQTKQVPVSAIVSGKASVASWDKIKNGLVISFVILAVILLILGIVLAFSRSRGKGDEKGEEGQSYY
jgi:uncharacterized membrane protein